MNANNATTDHLTDRAEDFVSSARDTYDRVVDRASDYMAGFNANPADYIRQHPMQAAVGGLVIGFLVGTAVSRRTITD